MEGALPPPPQADLCPGALEESTADARPCPVLSGCACSSAGHCHPCLCDTDTPEVSGHGQETPAGLVGVPLPRDTALLSGAELF